jgi:hypothetical protein
MACYGDSFTLLFIRYVLACHNGDLGLILGTATEVSHALSGFILLIILLTLNDKTE